jgi:hypothetical protein
VSRIRLPGHLGREAATELVVALKGALKQGEDVTRGGKRIE